MIRTSRLLAATGGFALVAASISPAFAAGTTAGTDITNTATVSFNVGGVAQNTVSGSDTFKVDRKVNLTVTEVGNTTTTVSPGQTLAVTTFEVTNTSNAAIDVRLVAAQLTGGTAPHSGTDSFDVTNVKVFVDSNGNGVYDAADTQIFIDELAADAKKTVFIVADVPLTQVTGNIAAVSLTAVAAAAGTAGTLGSDLTATVGANTAGVDTVLADAAGSDDAIYDGKFSARDDYTVLAAALTVVKTSRIVSDPVNGTTNPKFIPGAVVEYCIAVSNAAGGAEATNVGVNDPVPTQLDYASTFGVKVDGTKSGTTCTAGATNGTYTAATTTVSGTIASLPAGSTKTLMFQAIIK